MIRLVALLTTLLAVILVVGGEAGAGKAQKSQMVKGTIKSVDTSKDLLIVNQKVKNEVVDRELSITADTEFVVNAGGRRFTVRAEREVIVSAGTVNTARLLQLSGVGAARELEPLGIPVVVDLPGVGANLHDHLISVTLKKLRTPEPASHLTAMDVNVFTGRGRVPGTPAYEFQVDFIRDGYPPFPGNSTAIGAMNLHPTSRGYVR